MWRWALVFFCLVHLVVFYAASAGVVRMHINRRLLKNIMFSELAVVTGFLLCDTLRISQRFVLIICIVIVYVLIFMTWLVLRINTKLDCNKIYAMTVKNEAYYADNLYFEGYVKEKSREIKVLLPQSELQNPKRKQYRIVPVKFKEILNGAEIIVTIA